MKRGFEENVPKVRPRVRLGRALDEQLAESEALADAEAQPSFAAGADARATDADANASPADQDFRPYTDAKPDTARAAAETLPPPSRWSPRAVEATAAAPHEKIAARAPAGSPRAEAVLPAPKATRAAARASTAAQEVAQLARELTGELQAAADTNEIARIAGDTGAKHLIGEHADLVCEVEMTGEAAITDIDTPEALAAWRRRTGKM